MMENYVEFNENDFSKWLYDKGDETLRMDYNLNKESIVVDAGGYMGVWSENIYNKYGCKIFIFEPLKKYFNLMSEKFKNNPDIKVFNFGLSNESKYMDIYDSGDSSSVFGSGPSEKIKLECISDFFESNNIINVDLFKINIEGGEYDLLDDILDKSLNNKIKNIQVQFHRFVPDCIQRRENIRSRLRETHDLTYDYEFIWENWKIKDDE